MNELIKKLDDVGYRVRTLDGEYVIETKDWQSDNFYFSLIKEAIQRQLEEINLDDMWTHSLTDD